MQLFTQNEAQHFSALTICDRQLVFASGLLLNPRGTNEQESQPRGVEQFLLERNADRKRHDFSFAVRQVLLPKVLNKPFGLLLDVHPIVTIKRSYLCSIFLIIIAL